MPRFLWTQKQNFGPKPRVGHTITYDSNRKQSILFGGDSMNNHLFNDTWEWDGNYWTQVADMGVSARRDHAMTYDVQKQNAIVFGGTDNSKKLDDTWVWDGEDWTQISNSGPQARSGHALVYNSVKQTTIMFGGESAAGVLGDTWEFDGEEWTQKDDSGPSARKFHALAYDASRDKVILFGGTESITGLGDTWEWDGTAWTQTADFGPSPCLGIAMVFTNSRTALFGGIDSIDAASLLPHNLINNSWEWDGKHWTQRQDIGPGSRYGHSMIFDTDRKTIVLFGGSEGYTLPGDPGAATIVLGDTWEHLDTDSSQTSNNTIAIASLVLTPDSIPQSQLSSTTVIVAVTLNAPAPTGGLTIPIAVVDQTTYEHPPQNGLQITPVSALGVPANSLTTQTSIAPGIITQSSYIICVYDPSNTGNYVSALLSITSG